MQLNFVVSMKEKIWLLYITKKTKQVLNVGNIFDQI